MAPRHRQVQTGQIRSHSRSTSATRLGPNLQITHKDQHAKHLDKSRKNDVRFISLNLRCNLTHPCSKYHSKAPPGIQRVGGDQRVIPSKQNGNAKSKPGFTLSNQGDDEDDEWVSTESGAASPDHSDHEASTGGLQERLQHIHLPAGPPEYQQPETPRLSQAFENRVEPLRYFVASPPTSPPPIESHIQYPRAQREPPPFWRDASSETMKEPLPFPDLPPSRRNTKPPSSSSKRRSRPPSMHSSSTRTEPALRPHHLSYIPKQGPLAPLTVIPDGATVDPISPGQAYHEVDEITSSPSSLGAADAAALKRRSSISSARSVSTAPVFCTKETPRPIHERTRTLSTIPTSSSSAALSSLTHLPAVTRPPSPQPVLFFPRQNPHANVDNIHPLLPSPYMSNHMTVLARRTPLRESYDRVTRAKLAASR